MSSTYLQAELITLFEQKQFQTILDRANEEITPAAVKTANIVAAASSNSIILIAYFGARLYLLPLKVMQTLPQCMGRFSDASVA